MSLAFSPLVDSNHASSFFARGMFLLKILISKFFLRSKIAQAFLVKVFAKQKSLFIYSLPILLVAIEMAELVVKIPEELEKEIEELSVDKSKFALEAMEERLAELKLEKSKAFRKLLLSVFNRMTENSKLSDEDCLRLGREVNEELAKRYGLVK